MLLGALHFPENADEFNQTAVVVWALCCGTVFAGDNIVSEISLSGFLDQPDQKLFGVGNAVKIVRYPIDRDARKASKGFAVGEYPGLDFVDCDAEDQVWVSRYREPFPEQSGRAFIGIEIGKHEEGRCLGGIVETGYCLFKVTEAASHVTSADGEIVRELVQDGAQDVLA